jgi:hypothetical protein
LPEAIDLDQEWKIITTKAGSDWERLGFGYTMMPDSMGFPFHLK